MTLSLAFKNTTGDYIGTGAGLGGRLTSAQADNNNWLIKQAVEALQAATGKTIDSATAVGNQLTITYTDATTDVITIPTATWTWRGEWEASTSYAANDLFSESGSVYLVLLAHTSATSFDPGESTASADLYQKILDYPSIPGFEISDVTFSPTLSHANSYIVLTASAGCLVTIDPAVDFPIWCEMHFRDETIGGVTFEVATPGSINPQFGCENVSAGTGSTITMKKRGSTDSWDIMGLLTTTSV